MKTINNIDNEIDKLLDAYRHQSRPALNPYFNSRLKARIDAQQRQHIYFGRLISVKLAAALFFIVINAVSIFSYVQSQQRLHEEEALSTLETQYAVEATNMYAYSFEN